MSLTPHHPPGSARVLALVTALTALTVVAPRVALGQASASSAAAQGLFDEARALMAKGKAKEACPKLEESQRLDPGSGTLVNLAKCYEDTGRIASAWSTYLEAASAAKAAGNPMREEAARAAAAGLAPRVSKLVVNVSPETQVPGLVVKRGGVPVGPPQWGAAVPADAGEHTVEASAPGFTPFRGVVRIEGEGTTGTFAVPKLVKQPERGVSPEPDAAGSGALRGEGSGLGTQRVVALAAGGVGVVGVAVGTIFGLKAMSSKDEADQTCRGTACTTDGGVTAGKDAYEAGNVATIGMVVGAVGLAGGLTLWLTAPAERPQSSRVPVGVAVGVGHVQIRGAF